MSKLFVAGILLTITSVGPLTAYGISMKWKDTKASKEHKLESREETRDRTLGENLGVNETSQVQSNVAPSVMKTGIG